MIRTIPVSTGETYKVTKHAYERFIQRYKKVYDEIPKFPMAILRKFLENCKYGGIPPNRHSKFQCLYLECEGWRFVVVPTNHLIVTIERVRSHEN